MQALAAMFPVERSRAVLAAAARLDSSETKAGDREPSCVSAVASAHPPPGGCLVFGRAASDRDESAKPLALYVETFSLSCGFRSPASAGPDCSTAKLGAGYDLFDSTLASTLPHALIEFVFPRKADDADISELLAGHRNGLVVSLATAALPRLAKERMTPDYCFVAALAGTEPKNLTPFVAASELDGAEASEGPTFKVDEVRHEPSWNCYKRKAPTAPCG
jgi:hypothetical protein